MYLRGEFSAQEQAAYENDHKFVKINLIDPDPAHLMALTTAGTPPDIFRLQAPELPGYLIQRMVLDLTDYFKTSQPLRLADLADVCKNYWYTGLNVGSGRIYGMVKDWSPDLTLWINKTIFQQGGVPIPSSDKRYTYQEIADIAKKLTRQEVDRPAIMGFGGDADNWFDRVVEVQLNSAGKSLYSDDFSQINLTSPEATAVLQYWYDLATANLRWNPLVRPPSSPGDSFAQGQEAIIQYGFWYGGSIAQASTGGKAPPQDTFMMLPAPKWGPTIKDPTIAATGGSIHARTRNPDEAWRFFEYFMAGQPAKDRAQAGWGVPALKSLLAELPADNPFQQQVRQVLDGELKIADLQVRFNPYISPGENVNSFTSSWQRNLEAALKGQITFRELLNAVQKDVNKVIGQNIGLYK
jgi:multiple sugar transport system substrate-binding protein